MSGRDENPAALVLVVAGDPERYGLLRLLVGRLLEDRADVVLVDEHRREPIDLADLVRPPTLSTFIVSGGLVQVEWRDQRRDFQADQGALAAARTHFRRPRPRPVDRQPRRRCQWLPGCR